MQQESLFTNFLTFDGPDLTPTDVTRISGQLGRVFEFMQRNEWVTLSQIQSYAGGSEAGCSARTRDLKKPRFGGHTVERRRVEGANGLWEYRLTVNE